MNWLCLWCQLKVSEEDRNKVKKDVDDTKKQLNEKMAVETKAKQDVAKLTSEKVITTAASAAWVI